MPRKSMTEHKQSPVVKFRIDKDVQTILEDLKHQNVNISEFIRNKIKSIDSEILKSLFPYFAIQRIETKKGDLTPDMMTRLIEISKEPDIKQKIGKLTEEY